MKLADIIKPAFMESASNTGFQQGESSQVRVQSKTFHPLNRFSQRKLQMHPQALFQVSNTPNHFFRTAVYGILIC